MLILYGENQYSQKLSFYHLYPQLTLTFFIENIVFLYYRDFDIVNFSSWCSDKTPQEIFSTMTNYNGLISNLIEHSWESWGKLGDHSSA